VLEVLETKSGSLLRTALSIVIRFKIKEALEPVRKLTSDADYIVQKLAISAVRVLEASDMDDV
jgi:hypothetical protein